MKDGLVYVATQNKGIQVVELEGAKAGFPDTGAPENDFQRNSAIFKGGYNREAVDRSTCRSWSRRTPTPATSTPITCR